MTNLAQIPTFSGTIPQQFTIEPLRGGQDIQRYLDRFPEEIYNRSPDSHLVKFLQLLLGDQGVNWLRKNYLQARLKFEELGIELFDLDDFFGDPIGFGRILEESYDRDPEGLISKDDWERIKAKDSLYRSRALDYFNGARLGNTKEGMRLVARGGLGHNVEIIENYRWLFDQHSDDPLGLDYYGKTLSTEEMIVLPRRDLPRSEVQRVTLQATGDVDLTSTFELSLPVGTTPHNTPPISAQASRDEMRTALEIIAAIGPGGVGVTGPVIHTSGRVWHWDITFTSYVDMPLFTVANGVSTSDPSDSVDISVETVANGGSSVDEVIEILPREARNLQEALDKIRAQTTIPTIGEARGLRQRINWGAVHSSSSYSEVLRYVTGSPKILWPARDQNLFWIERDKEHQGPRTKDGLDYHYQGFHSAQKAQSYTEAALDNETAYEASDGFSGAYASSHLGQFLPEQTAAYPFLAATPVGATFKPQDALADVPEPVAVSDMADVQGSTHSVLNRIYPIEYLSLPGAENLPIQDDLYWASLERDSGTEYLELDLGQAEAVNFVSFDISNKPVRISIAYDVLDQGPRRKFVDVTPATPFDSLIHTSATSINPWCSAQFFFTNSRQDVIFTRYIRIALTRLSDLGFPWSVEVRNLRIARNVS